MSLVSRSLRSWIRTPTRRASPSRCRATMTPAALSASTARRSPMPPTPASPAAPRRAARISVRWPSRRWKPRSRLNALFPSRHAGGDRGEGLFEPDTLTTFPPPAPPAGGRGVKGKNMAEITAASVKELRERTGAGMMDCKKALAENHGDMEASVDWLRAKGLAAAAKKAGRTAAEGLVGVAVEGTKGAVVEVNSETDFVAKNEQFQDFVRSAAGASGQWRRRGAEVGCLPDRRHG